MSSAINGRRRARRFAATIAAIAAIFCTLCAYGPGAGAANPAPVQMSNDFIRIVVNPGPEEAGRFGVETTGGDPRNPADDDLPLIYGRPLPLTMGVDISSKLAVKERMLACHASQRDWLRHHHNIDLFNSMHGFFYIIAG